MKKKKNVVPEIGKTYYGCIKKSITLKDEETQLYFVIVQCYITVNGADDYYWGYLPEDFESEEEVNKHIENKLGIGVAVTFKKHETEDFYIIDKIFSLK